MTALLEMRRSPGCGPLRGVCCNSLWSESPNSGSPSHRRRATYLIWIITLLSIPGFLLMLYRSLPVAALFGAIFLLFPLRYYIVVSEERYRLPILWLSCLAAGYLLTALPTRRQV